MPLVEVQLNIKLFAFCFASGNYLCKRTPTSDISVYNYTSIRPLKSTGRADWTIRVSEHGTPRVGLIIKYEYPIMGLHVVSSGCFPLWILPVTDMIRRASDHGTLRVRLLSSLDKARN